MKSKVPIANYFVGTWLPCSASWTTNSSLTRNSSCDQLESPSTTSFRPPRAVPLSPSFPPFLPSPSLPVPSSSVPRPSPFPLVPPFPEMILIFKKCTDFRFGHKIINSGRQGSYQLFLNTDCWYDFTLKTCKFFVLKKFMSLGKVAWTRPWSQRRGKDNVHNREGHLLANLCVLGWLWFVLFHPSA